MISPFQKMPPLSTLHTNHLQLSAITVIVYFQNIFLSGTICSSNVSVFDMFSYTSRRLHDNAIFKSLAEFLRVIRVLTSDIIMLHLNVCSDI